MEKYTEVEQVIKDFEEKTGNRLVYLTKSGSKLYGTDTPLSDTDYKGIFIPRKRDVLLKRDISSYTHDTNNTKEKNTSEDIDFSVHSVYAFFNQLQKSETGAVDTLFSMWSKPRKSKELIEIEENYTVDDIKKRIVKGDNIKDLLKKLKYK